MRNEVEESACEAAVVKPFASGAQCCHPVSRNRRIIILTSLPAAMRRETLLIMFRSSLEGHVKSGLPKDTWLHKYTLMGQSVCLDAFCLLTGISRWSVTQARDAARNGSRSSSSRSELPMHLAILPTSKPKLYLDARAWLECYAASHAESSPMKLEFYLPAGRKRYYHEQYAFERAQQNRPAASIELFYRMWREECPFVVICRSHSMFVKCGCCEYLRMQIDLTPRDDAELMNALKERLGAHFQFQSAQRLAEARMEEACSSSGGKKWFMHIGALLFVLFMSFCLHGYYAGLFQIMCVRIA
jgi:hypothetical protein